MINGAHFLMYSADSDADRAFFRDVLGFSAVDAGHGWLIFALPPAEVGFHPIEDGGPPPDAGQIARSSLYLMCDNLESTIAELASKGVDCEPIRSERWGHQTSFKLPSGLQMGLYQPTHPTAI